jgi:Putative zinc-finger
MAGESKNGMQCAEFEALLSEAVEQTLSGSRLESFQAHAQTCAVCGPMLAEGEEGRRWLKSLEEVAPPANLVHNILVATTGRESRSVRKEGISWKEAATGWLRPIIAPVFAVARQPRFAMSFGMAFFSFSITLSMAGVKISDLRHADLRPSALRRTYYETTGRIVKYYDNIRFVYEIESRLREFKRATTPAQPAPEKKEKERKNNTSGQPEQKQERNYSQWENHPVLAAAPDQPPVVSVTTTYRRNS